MVVYGHRSFKLNTLDFLHELLRRLEEFAAIPSRDALMDVLVDVGEAETAVADAYFSSHDDEADDLTPWRDLARYVAAAFCASTYGEHEAARSALVGAQGAARAALERPAQAVEAKTSEGFAFYALYPDQYINAAEQLLARDSGQRVFCLGIRGIGAILAHVVAAALERGGISTMVRSVRPRGHPFDRRLSLGDGLRKLITESAADVYAIVDEGPGLSGSSFASAADALMEIGIPASRIVLLPSWDADPDRLNSARGRTAWHSHRRVVGWFDAKVADGQELSAGKWRSVLNIWPAVQPQHERRKYLSSAHGLLWKFSGLGKYGRRKLERAKVLASAGFSPTPRALENGYVALDWIDPMHGIYNYRLTDNSSPPSALLDRVAQYLAFIKRQFATGDSDDIDELEAMLVTNAGEARIPVDVDACAAVARRLVAERVAVDGRMLAHEWIGSPWGFLKTDALDHHDDDFFPGCRDIAWDIAGAIAELGLDQQAAGALVDKYRRLSRDTSIAERLPFYQHAYLGYRLGYVKLAADTVADADDAVRFRDLYRMYGRQLTELAQGRAGVNVR
jgi:hypothetical protein